MLRPRPQTCDISVPYGWPPQMRVDCQLPNSFPNSSLLWWSWLPAVPGMSVWSPGTQSGWRYCPPCHQAPPQQEKPWLPILKSQSAFSGHCLCSARVVSVEVSESDLWPATFLHLLSSCELSQFNPIVSQPCLFSCLLLHRFWSPSASRDLFLLPEWKTTSVPVRRRVWM